MARETEVLRLAESRTAIIDKIQQRAFHVSEKIGIRDTYSGGLTGERITKFFDVYLNTVNPNILDHHYLADNKGNYDISFDSESGQKTLIPNNKIRRAASAVQAGIDSLLTPVRENKFPVFLVFTNATGMHRTKENGILKPKLLEVFLCLRERTDWREEVSYISSMKLFSMDHTSLVIKVSEDENVYKGKLPHDLNVSLPLLNK